MATFKRKLIMTELKVLLINKQGKGCLNVTLIDEVYCSKVINIDDVCMFLIVVQSNYAYTKAYSDTV